MLEEALRMGTVQEVAPNNALPISRRTAEISRGGPKYPRIGAFPPGRLGLWILALCMRSNTMRVQPEEATEVTLRFFSIALGVATVHFFRLMLLGAGGYSVQRSLAKG